MISEEQSTSFNLDLKKSFKLQYVFLIANLLSPCLIAPYLLRLTKCGILTLFFFHLALIVPPIIYIHSLSPKKMRKR